MDSNAVRMIENLSFNHTLEALASSAVTRFSRQGKGVRVGIRRKQGLFGGRVDFSIKLD
ncbi:MAG: hypothetical protein PHQ47_03935 [Candidatus Portnoybacteria bacterium]|nr:hypothetical protein [Candidatus Portnoybacteria bacterium]